MFNQWRFSAPHETNGNENYHLILDRQLHTVSPLLGSIWENERLEWSLDERNNL